jgi:hypothetical protein
MKIMLEADTFIYVLLRDFILSNINSRNNYTEHGITKIMYFSRHHIGSVVSRSINNVFKEVLIRKPKNYEFRDLMIISFMR